MKKTYLAALFIALGAILVPTLVFTTEPIIDAEDNLLAIIDEQGSNMSEMSANFSND